MANGFFEIKLIDVLMRKNATSTNNFNDKSKMNRTKFT